MTITSILRRKLRRQQLIQFTVSRPLVRAAPYLNVAVRRLSLTSVIGRFKLEASWTAKPVIPEAFRDDSKRPNTDPPALRITN